MGLTSWKGEVVRKVDVTIAKNYLRDDEISELNRIVVMFLDYAEDQARRRRQIFLRDWKGQLDAFLRFNERAVLPGAGRVSREAADEKAEQAYEQFSAHRRTQREEEAQREAMEELKATIRKLPKRDTPKSDEPT